MVTDHKNLEYFMSSKKLSCHQARWAEFLGQFNMKVRFRPERLGSKLDTLTCRWYIYIARDHPTAGHFGETKTTELTHCNYHWPGMRRMVGDYVRSCTSCACTKAMCHKPYGLLKQLPTPGQPWESISMDFIEQLPASEGFTAILVIMDRLTKQLLFIPTHDTVDTPQLARLFLTHIFSKHGAPGHVTSNHGTEFMSHFFCSLGSLLSMKLHFMSGYHPEGDGQTERINQVLEQYLQAYTNFKYIRDL